MSLRQTGARFGPYPGTGTSVRKDRGLEDRLPEKVETGFRGSERYLRLDVGQVRRSSLCTGKGFFTRV